ncbi:MAG: FxsA family protein [Myxococcales bacterium]|nr:FxsA family protein [Myxococcales bacterium]
MFARLLLLFTVVPLVELFLLLKVGSIIGPVATLAIVVVTGALGAALAKSQGARVMSRIREETRKGRLPADDMIGGLLILLAGAFLITPGVITDACGFLMLVPPIRRSVAAAIKRSLASSIQVHTFGGFPGQSGWTSTRPKDDILDGPPSQF